MPTRFLPRLLRIFRRYGYPAVAFCLLAQSPVWARSADALIRQAEDAWENRDQPGQTEAAIAAWEGALQADGRRGDLYVPLTRAANRAYRQAKDAPERRQWADRARAYGKMAIKRNPETPQALAEHATALGQWAQSRKGWGSFRSVREAVQLLQEAVRMDPHYAYAHMLLASFYHGAPGIISVGDDEKALKHARLAVEYAPNYAINRITLAKVLLERGEKEEARKQLTAALTVITPPDAIPETSSDQATAKEMLKNI